MKVTKAEMISQLHAKGFTYKSSRDVIDAFTETIIENLKQGNEVVLPGFGKFTLVARSTRTVSDFKGGRIVSEAHFVPRFFPGTEIRKAVAIYNADQKK